MDKKEITHKSDTYEIYTSSLREYNIMNKMGEGRECIVFECNKKGSSTVLALKIRPLKDSGDEELYKTDIEYSKQMDTFNIGPEIYDNFTIPALWYTVKGYNPQKKDLGIIIMEKFDFSLGNLLFKKENEKFMTPSVKDQINKNLVSILANLTDKNLFHADLSNANIVLRITNNEIVKLRLIDFSLIQEITDYTKIININQSHIDQISRHLQCYPIPDNEQSGSIWRYIDNGS